jgi:hypothetical protein
MTELETIPRTEYPKWLVEAIVQFNRDTTCMNEYELLGMTVDLQRQPDLPRRLDVLFEALRKGFNETGTLISASFLVLGYKISSAQRFVRPKFISLGKGMKTLTELPGTEDEDALKHAYRQGVAAAQDKIPAGGRRFIFQLPYFICKIGESPEAEDLSYDGFHKLFDQGDVLFVKPQPVVSEEEAAEWISDHPANKYEQRFVLTLVISVTNGFEDRLKTKPVEEGLVYLFGSFLSWAGMGAGDSTRYLLASAAARLAHYSHEFLKPIAELKNYANQNESSLPPELREKLENVFSQSQLLDLTDLRSAFEPGTQLFLNLLITSLSKATTFPPSAQVKDGDVYAIEAKLPGIERESLSIKFVKPPLPEQELKIKFDPSYFDRLLRNLIRNAVDHNKQVPREIEIAFDVDDRNRMMIMDFKQRGARIPLDTRRSLFRVPVKSLNQLSGTNRGIGLWTVGLAFEAQRLPTPEVIQDRDNEGVRFRFKFVLA